MNYIDILIAAPFLYAIIKGFLNGVIKEITGFFSFFVSIYIAIKVFSDVNPVIKNTLSLESEINSIVSFSITFIAVILCIRIASYFLKKITDALALGFISQLLGAVFGFLKITLIYSVVLFIITEYQMFNIEIKDQKSILLKPLQKTSQMLMPNITKHKEVIFEKIKKETEN